MKPLSNSPEPDNEIPLEAAYREMFAESGIEKSKVALLKQSKLWYRYDLPKEIQGKFWGGKFRGQSKKWFLFKFIGSDDDINIETKDQEFSHWKWSNKTDMLDSIVPFKKSLYQDVLNDFNLEF